MSPPGRSRPGGPGGRRCARTAATITVSAVLAATAAGVAFLAGPAPVSAQAHIVLVIPEPGPDDWPDEGGRHRVRVGVGGFDVERTGELGGPGGGSGAGSDVRREISVLTFGEFSPANPAAYAAQSLTIQIVSPWGYFPRYRVAARLIPTGSSGPGDLADADMGLGVTRVQARNPIIDPRFDHDPQNAAKDVDDVPLFVGSLANLTTGIPRTELFRTRRTGWASTNEFELTFAVGPQFFTPEPFHNFVIELSVELI